MASIVSAITGYIIIVSTLYLLGYWTEFGVNYLEYITISEVAVVGLNALVASFGFIVLAALLSHIYLGSIFKIGEGRDTPEGQFVNKWWKVIILPFIVMVLYVIYTGKPLGLFLLAIVFAPIIGVWVANQGFLESVVDNPEIRFSIIYVAIFIIFLAHPKGFLDAYSRKDTSTDHQVMVSEGQYTYVGKLNNSLFLYNKENERIIQLTPIPSKIQYIPNKLPQPIPENGAAEL